MLWKDLSWEVQTEAMGHCYHTASLSFLLAPGAFERTFQRSPNHDLPAPKCGLYPWKGVSSLKDRGLYNKVLAHTHTHTSKLKIEEFRASQNKAKLEECETVRGCSGWGFPRHWWGQKSGNLCIPEYSRGSAMWVGMSSTPSWSRSHVGCSEKERQDFLACILLV